MSIKKGILKNLIKNFLLVLLFQLPFSAFSSTAVCLYSEKNFGGRSQCWDVTRGATVDFVGWGWAYGKAKSYALFDKENPDDVVTFCGDVYGNPPCATPLANYGNIPPTVRANVMSFKYGPLKRKDCYSTQLDLCVFGGYVFSGQSKCWTKPAQTWDLTIKKVPSLIIEGVPSVSGYRIKSIATYPPVTNNSTTLCTRHNLEGTCKTIVPNWYSYAGLFFAYKTKSLKFSCRLISTQ